jgi:phosphopantothenoylcysteine decarboxylase/phosphopantothenate--cysteine ligase
VVGPTAGALVGGDEGPGRMVEPEMIVAALEDALGAGTMAGWSVLVTAGGTREPVDPVRYLGNRSSGKMGNAIAVEAAERGAIVVLVTTMSAPSHPRIRVESVETAAEMAEVVWREAAAVDAAVLAAAVADFRPADRSETKVRRELGVPELRLEPTPDILAGVAAMDTRPFLIGFAAETGPVSAAAPKAASKGVDLLVANDVTDPESGFGTDTNRVTVFTPDGLSEEWPTMTKQAVASRLWDRVLALRSL